MRNALAMLLMGLGAHTYATTFMIPSGFTEKPMFGRVTSDSAWLAKWMAPPSR